MKEVEISPVYDVKLSAAATEVLNTGLTDLLMGIRPYDIASKLQAAHAQSRVSGNEGEDY